MSLIHPDESRADVGDATSRGAPGQLEDLDLPSDVNFATRFRAVFDHAPIGQIYTDLNGIITLVNEPLAAVVGYTPQQMIGCPALAFVYPGEHDQVRATAAALLAGDQSCISEVRVYQHKDGHPVHVRVNSTVLRDEAGAPSSWVSMVLDMSEEQRSRAQLERAHTATVEAAQRLKMLHAVSAAANDATVLADLAPTVLTEVCGHFGWPAGALVLWPTHAPPTVLVAYGSPAVALDGLPEPVDDRLTVSGGNADEPRLLVSFARTRLGRFAWLFDSGDGALDDVQREVVHLTGNESHRVVEREIAEQMLRDGETRFRSVFDYSPLPMGLTIGNTGTYSAVNDALCELLGRSAEELAGMSAAELCHPDDRALTDPAGAAAAAAPDGRHTFELRFVRRSGEVIVTNTTLIWMDGPDGTRQLLAQIEDITARRTMEHVLRRQANEDDLTGLANRARLGHVLAEKAAGGGTCAVLFIDLDGFKLINDTRGHNVGDDVLRTVAARLRAAVRPHDLVARFGGDEFVVVCDAQSGREHTLAQRIATRIEQTLSDPVPTHSGAATITSSIGIAAGPVDADHPQSLVQQADAAMYEAKRLGKDRCEVYDVRLHEQARRDQHTEAALRNALAEGRFAVHYQPIVNLDDATIVGFEALVRLVDEDGSLVRPDRFIEVAERSGLIVPMGVWVLQESCRTIARLREQTGRPLTVAVNLAARQASRRDLGQVVRAALDESFLPDSALTLELTESSLLEADASTLEQLVRLRRRGVAIALDDFGTGYSSLSYLRRFPVGHLKVDRSFVSGMVEDASDRAIVRAVTKLADDLGMRWVAEGVETEEQRAALSAMGAGLAQGYLFSRPRPAADLPGLLGVDEAPIRRTA